MDRKQAVESAWIQTYSNKKFHILAPRREEICVEDIAHALSMQCRYTGHCRWHYSVAQHAYLASLFVAAPFAYEALHHDDSEAYICDMNRPMKHFTAAGEAYLEVEDVIQTTINAIFGLPYDMSPEVKEADTRMLYAEKAVLMPPMEWGEDWGIGTENPAPVAVKRWSPLYAEMMYLWRHYQLTVGEVEGFKRMVKWAIRKLSW